MRLGMARSVRHFIQRTGVRGHVSPKPDWRLCVAVSRAARTGVFPMMHARLQGAMRMNALSRMRRLAFDGTVGCDVRASEAAQCRQRRHTDVLTRSVIA